MVHIAKKAKISQPSKGGLDLPDDLLHHISRFLTVHETLQAAMCCKGILRPFSTGIQRMSLNMPWLRADTDDGREYQRRQSKNKCAVSLLRRMSGIRHMLVQPKATTQFLQACKKGLCRNLRSAKFEATQYTSWTPTRAIKATKAARQVPLQEVEIVVSNKNINILNEVIQLVSMDSVDHVAVKIYLWGYSKVPEERELALLNAIYARPAGAKLRSVDLAGFGAINTLLLKHEALDSLEHLHIEEAMNGEDVGRYISRAGHRLRSLGVRVETKQDEVVARLEEGCAPLLNELSLDLGMARVTSRLAKAVASRPLRVLKVYTHVADKIVIPAVRNGMLREFHVTTVASRAILAIPHTSFKAPLESFVCYLSTPDTALDVLTHILTSPMAATLRHLRLTMCATSYSISQDTVYTTTLAQMLTHIKTMEASWLKKLELTKEKEGYRMIVIRSRTLSLPST